jgi:hypothetical protein
MELSLSICRENSLSSLPFSSLNLQAPRRKTRLNQFHQMDVMAEAEKKFFTKSITAQGCFIHEMMHFLQAPKPLPLLSSEQKRS